MPGAKIHVYDKEKHFEVRFYISLTLDFTDIFQPNILHKCDNAVAYSTQLLRLAIDPGMNRI